MVTIKRHWNKLRMIYFITGASEKNKNSDWYLSTVGITFSHVLRNPDKIVAYFCPLEKSQGIFDRLCLSTQSGFMSTQSHMELRSHKKTSSSASLADWWSKFFSFTLPPRPMEKNTRFENFFIEVGTHNLLEKNWSYISWKKRTSLQVSVTCKFGFDTDG